MAQDYKSRANGRKSSSKPRSPLLPFLAGMMVGLFLMALAWLKLGPSFPGIENRVASAPRPAPNSEKHQQPAPSQRYDFYTILPEMEVLIPEEEISQPETEQITRINKPTTAKPTTHSGEGSYMLQMGSFRKRKDAERRRAQLAMIGIEAEIQAVNAGTSEALYRVRSGPYRSRQTITKVRALARQNSIDSLPIKLKK